MFHHLIFACFLRIVSSNVVINTNSGPIRGTASLTENVVAYLGIPYAEPPVNDLRFAKPVPKRKWKDVYDNLSISIIYRTRFPEKF